MQQEIYRTTCNKEKRRNMITQTIHSEEVSRANALIRKAQSVAILTHMSPDGDAMGSSLAMKLYLQALGKETIAVIVPNSFPDFLAWLPDAGNILVYDKQEEESKTIIANTDLIICLDFNDTKRIGKMGEAVEQSAAKKIVLDHHLFPQDFANITMSYPHASSTSELVFRFICQSGDFGLLNTSIATCIYTGIMTDTGNFSYSSNNPELYQIAAELMKQNIDKDAIYDQVFNTYSVSRMRLTGYCLYRKMRILGKNTALIALSKDELLRFNFQSGDGEGLVNLPLQIANVHYSVFMREDKDKIKISFRSQGERPVNEFAAKYFNGGGHKNAAGGESYDSLEDTVKRFEQHFREYFKKEQQ